MFVYRVNSISDDSFRSVTNITSITITINLERIQFKNNNNLTCMQSNLCSDLNIFIIQKKFIGSDIFNTLCIYDLVNELSIYRYIHPD